MKHVLKQNIWILERKHVSDHKFRRFEKIERKNEVQDRRKINQSEMKFILKMKNNVTELSYDINLRKLAL